MGKKLVPLVPTVILVAGQNSRYYVGVWRPKHPLRTDQIFQTSTANHGSSEMFICISGDVFYGFANK